MAGPRTWMAARELYLSGLTAGEVGERLGLTVSAIRARITREEWTKSAHADARLGPALAAATAPAADRFAPGGAEPCGEDDGGPAPDLDALAQEVGRRAAQALVRGQVAEAAALARAGQQVLDFLANLPEARPPHDPELTTQMWCEDVWATAVRLADQLLKDGHVPAVHTRAAFQWRADKLGPEVAARDRARSEGQGIARTIYDETGAILPPESFEAFSARVKGRSVAPRP